MFGFPGVGDITTSVINDIAKAIWGFVSSLLTGIFSYLDSITQPTIVYTPGGPLGKVLPICLWLGLMLAIGLSFAQAGLAVINGPKSLLALLKGIGQYVMASAASLTVLSLVNTFAALCATGIVQSSFNVKNWQGLGGDQTFMAESVKGLSGMALGLMSLFLVLPFALGILTELLIRYAAMEVLAATIPIVVAGLVHEKFARWYWTAVRWMLALIFMLPLLALSLAIGHSIGLAAGHSQSGGTGGQLTQAAVSAIVCDLSLVWPFALFKLFAFVDPNTVAGSNFRASMPSFGGKSSGGEDTEGESAQAEGTSDDGAGAATSPGGGGSGKSTSGGMGASGMLQAGMEALGSFGSSDTAASANDRAAQSLDGVGAGHAGGGGTPQQEDDDDDAQRQESDSDSQSRPDGPSDPAPTADSQGGFPGDPSGMSGPQSPGGPGGGPGGGAAADSGAAGGAGVEAGAAAAAV